MTSAIALNEVYAIIFYAVSLISLFIGAYVFVLNSSEKLNRLILMISITLGIWAFSYSMISASSSYEAALAWNRVSSLGWGMIYSLLLHYFIILTGRDRILSNYATYILIYLPALVVLYVFGINGSIAKSEFELVQTAAGWVNKSSNSFFDWFFYLYFVLYSLFSILLLWRWWSQTDERRVKRTVLILTISLAVSLSIGGLTDVLFRSAMQDVRPQLGVIYAIIPVFAIIYSIKKHGIIRLNILNTDPLPGRILSHEKRIGFYYVLAAILIAGSLLYLSVDYLVISNPLSSVLLLSFYLFVLGIYIGILPSLKVSEKSQDFQLGLLMSILTPVLTLYLYRDDYNNVIWALPIVLMIISTVFFNRSILISILISAIVFESVLHLSNIEFYSDVSINDFNQRIVLYLVAAGLVNFVGLLYRQRIIENERQTEIQRQISLISSAFIDVNENTINDKIDSILQQSGLYFNMDRACLFQVEQNSQKMEQTNIWCSNGFEYSKDDHRSLKYTDIPWIISELGKNQFVNVSDISLMPAAASSERELLQSFNIKSFMAVAIIKNDELDGMLCFENYEVNRYIDLSHKDALLIVAHIISDALSKVNSETTIKYLAYYDDLTGLPNRTSMKNRLEKEIARSQYIGSNIGILLYDLDDFKSVNDSLGHDTGDKMIKSIATRLIEISGREAVVCRFGGDEFLTIVPNIKSDEELMLMAKKTLDVFKEPVVLNYQSFYISASCGVAVYPQDGLDVETLVRSADLAMYRSKSIGKNVITFCTEELKASVDDKTKLINDLHNALENNELILHYQPQIEIESGEVIGFEALLRWNHPERGIIPPGLFIPLAEQTELIHSIGRWVIQEACRQNRKWQEDGYTPVVMAVNLSVEQFRNKNLAGMMAEELAISRLMPEYFEVEITESIAILAPEYIIGILNQLKALGISIAIDDFGTEYSSLSRLRDLPIDYLKIAMEFVRGIGKNSRDEAVVGSIINLAKSLGLKIIAEGVETQEQLDFLQNNLCDIVQGFFYYRPMPAENAEKLLKKNSLRTSEKLSNRK